MANYLQESERTKIGTFLFTRIQQLATDLIRDPAAKFILLFGGSRSGKTAILICIIFMRAFLFPGSRHLIARYRFNHAKTSLWYDTLPKVAKAMGMHTVMHMNKSDWFILFDNGSEIWIGGLDDKERLEKVLGNEYATIYLNEASQISYLALVTLMSRLAQKIPGLKNKIFIDCNPPTKRHWIYQLFFLFRDPETKVAIPEHLRGLYKSMMMNPADNTANITEDYLQLLDLMPERQRKRFKDGKFLDDVEGALFKQENIDQNREELAKGVYKIAIGIDPATTSEESSDLTGIIVAACTMGTIKNPSHGFILEDASGTYTPGQWAKEAIRLYEKYDADFIVAETNQGGEMVKHTIHSEDPNVKVYTVHASKSKVARAEPVSAMYEQGRVHHIGLFSELEEEMTTFTGKDGEKSPDRYDAMVYVLTKLMIKTTIDDEPTGPSAPRR